MMDAAVHSYDAADPVLPLIGGGTGTFHDFVLLFDRYGMQVAAKRPGPCK